MPQLQIAAYYQEHGGKQDGFGNWRHAVDMSFVW